MVTSPAGRGPRVEARSSKLLVALAGLAITATAVASTVAPGPCRGRRRGDRLPPDLEGARPRSSPPPRSGRVGLGHDLRLSGGEGAFVPSAGSTPGAGAPVVRPFSPGHLRGSPTASGSGRWSSPAARPRAIPPLPRPSLRLAAGRMRRFSIVQLDAELGPVSGGAPTALPLRIENPNDIPILVTSITVTSAIGPPAATPSPISS